MDENKDKLSKALGLEPFNIKKQIDVVINNSTSDVDQAKENIKDIIMKGKMSFDDLLDVARMSEHPRAYEVAATFLKALVDANRELVDINIKQQEIKQVQDNRQVHNHMYIGSTADLLKMMKSTADNE